MTIPQSVTSNEGLMEIGKGIDDSYPYSLNNRTQKFDPDQKVYGRMELGNLGREIKIRWRWQDPDETLSQAGEFTQEAGPGYAWVVYSWHYHNSLNGIGRVVADVDGDVIGIGYWKYLGATARFSNLSYPDRVQPGQKFRVNYTLTNTGKKGILRGIGGSLTIDEQASSEGFIDAGESDDTYYEQEMPPHKEKIRLIGQNKYWIGGEEQYNTDDSRETNWIRPMKTALIDSDKGIRLIGVKDSSISYKMIVWGSGINTKGLESEDLAGSTPLGKAVSIKGTLSKNYDEDRVEGDSVNALQLETDTPISIAIDDSVVKKNTTTFRYTPITGQARKVKGRFMRRKPNISLNTNKKISRESRSRSFAEGRTS